MLIQVHFLPLAPAPLTIYELQQGRRKQPRVTDEHLKEYKRFRYLHLAGLGKGISHNVAELTYQLIA